MKRKILALVASMTLVLGMSLSANAAGSPSASTAAASTETVVTTPSGQNISAATLQTYASEVSIASTDAKDAKVTATSPAAAVSLAYFAGKEVGENAKVLTMVDITASSAGTFTINVPGVVAGQSVTVIHLKSSTEDEVLPATAGNGTVTFSMTTYSPVAVVANATSPKTGANTFAMALAAIAALGVAVYCAKRYAK